MPASRRSARRVPGLSSAVLRVFEVESQQPGNFSLRVQHRVRSAQLLLQASYLCLERTDLGIQSVALLGLTPRFLEDGLCNEPSRQTVRGEQYNRSRRSNRPTSPGSVQRTASSGTRSRYVAVNWRRVGLAATCEYGGTIPLRCRPQCRQLKPPACMPDGTLA